MTSRLSGSFGCGKVCIFCRDVGLHCIYVQIRMKMLNGSMMVIKITPKVAKKRCMMACPMWQKVSFIMAKFHIQGVGI